MEGRLSAEGAAEVDVKAFCNEKLGEAYMSLPDSPVKGWEGGPPVRAAILYGETVQGGCEEGIETV